MRTSTIFIFLFAGSLAFISPLYAQLYNSGQLYIDSGVVLYVKDTLQNNASGAVSNKGTMSAGGTLINNASINGKGKVVLSGASAQNVLGTGVISNLEVNTAGATIVTGNRQSITGTLTLTSGILASDSGLVLRSTDSNTARVAPVLAGSVTGNVTIERYIPARRAWRLITAPVANAGTIRNTWQTNGTYVPGTGTFITGPGGTNGLDNGNGYSLDTFNVASQQLVAGRNTKLSLSSPASSAANKGYFLFVRGDRNPSNMTPPNTNATTLSSVGTLQSGTQVFTSLAGAGNFMLIGNPYASSVDFNSVTRSNIVKRFYSWDPTLNLVGGYVTVDDFDEDGTYSITPASAQTNVLQSSQAFFVQATNPGSASITFNESSKSTVVNNAGFRAGNGGNEILRTSLYLKNADTAILADGVLSEYSNNYTKEVSVEDGPKMPNLNENLTIQRDGHSLSIERRPLVDINDTLFLNLTNTTVRNYQFRFQPANISSVMAAWLEDSYLKTITPVDVAAPSIVDFSVNANPASAAASRFMVVFKTNGVLPISSINVNASQQNAGVQVDWNIATENDMKLYEVEKSTDGLSFIKVGTAVVSGNSNAAANYNWFDANAATGNNFYRIKAVGKSGEFKYSNVVIIKIGNGKAGMVVYPNPVQNRVISLQITNEPAGRYTVELLNALGQRLLTKAIEHAGGSATKAIPLGSMISKGVYQLHVSNGDNKINQQIIIP